MNCEFDACLYNQAHRCILENIQIDDWGMCEDCEAIRLPPETFEAYKKKRLKEIQDAGRDDAQWQKAKALALCIVPHWICARESAYTLRCTGDMRASQKNS